MYSIKEKTVSEIEIKKSRFIGVSYPVNDETETNDILKNIRKEYPNANHYTYAYVLGDNGIIQKASDDGEPTRTAGFPILEVIHKNELTNILVIVIRYFGGIKLGAGGLIRAYSSSATDVLSKTILTKKITTYECKVTCSYDNLGNIDKFVRENTNLLDIKYDQDITFFFKITKDQLDMVKEQLFNKNSYQDLLEIIDETSEYA